MTALVTATVSFVCVGALVGWFASAAVTNIDVRTVLTMLVGIAGAIGAGSILELVGLAAWGMITEVMAGIGAIGLLLMIRPWGRP